MSLEDSYAEAVDGFEWDLPEDYNAAHDLLRKHEDSTRTALVEVTPDGERTYSFRELDERSDRVAAGLVERGVGRGDRVAVVLSQQVENPLVHLACWKVGAVSIPLSVLFGPDALRYRLRDSDARVAVVDPAVAETVDEVSADCPGLEDVFVAPGPGERVEDGTATFADLEAAGTPGFELAETTPDTPAVVMYTSGSTGPPKGVLHRHALWVGSCPSFLAANELDPTESVFYTPADWAWIGALGNVVFPPWHYGQTVVCRKSSRFDPEETYRVFEDQGVTNAFIPPTALRMMRDAEDPEAFDLALDTVVAGGEALTPELREWFDDALPDVTVNEIYGQTEANVFVCTCNEWFDPKVGSSGKPVPGHEAAILDDDGAELPPGEVGEIAVAYEGDPMVYVEYWNAPERTAAARTGRWHRTGDLGSIDEDGYLWFKSRKDDVIITAGYRVGPGEVETTLLDHPDVAQVGVIGVPDDTRGEQIKAFVQPVADAEAGPDLREALRGWVRERLAEYEYPREIEFVSEFPQTTSGKLKRRELREREQEE